MSVTAGDARALLRLLRLLPSAYLGVALSADAAAFGEGPKLTTPSSVEMGSSVALSSDGTTAIVGSPGDHSQIGGAYVYTRVGGHWMYQDKLVGAGVSNSIAEQGSSVALSSDGSTALVGAPSDGSGIGAAWVFTRTGGVWAAGGTKLTPTSVGGPSHVGASVALSSDGTVALLGAPGDIQHGATIGAGLVFTFSGGVWSQTTKLFGNVRGTPAAGAQGTSVALSSDGATALVGGPLDASAGAAWVFTRSGTVWSLQGGKLTGTGEAFNPALGWSAALTADGNLALVGGPKDGFSIAGQVVGAAWVFARDENGSWSQQGDKLVGLGEAGYGQFGSSAALSKDGNIALLGGPDDGGTVGAAWVFTRACIGLAGDVNGSNGVDIADVFFLINFLFASGPAPVCR
jgi:hypothetical protein